MTHHLPLSALCGKAVRVRQDGGAPWRCYLDAALRHARRAAPLVAAGRLAGVIHAAGPFAARPAGPQAAGGGPGAAGGAAVAGVRRPVRGDGGVAAGAESRSVHAAIVAAGVTAMPHHLPLSTLVGLTVRFRTAPGCPWRCVHVWWPDPESPVDCLRVSDLGDFGEPAGEVYSLRLGWGGRRDVDLEVMDPGEG